MMRPPPPKVDYNALPVPRNYVAGAGRGATGFTTRSDIGPARPGMGAAEKEAAKKEEEKALDDSKFDHFLGNDSGAFAQTGEYDEDDKEADRVWEQVDAHMDERRRERREAALQEQIKKYREENPKITDQFADLKRKLADVSHDEWEAIPEIGDYTIKNKKRFESFAPATDTLLAQAAKERQATVEVASGLETPAAGMQTDLNAVGEGRNSMLSLKLDRMADDVQGQTVVDPKGYMTDLNSVQVSSDSEVSDTKRAFQLFRSVVTTNPKHAPGWIALARMEERMGKLAAARATIMKGVGECPKSEDVWLEASRLQPPDNARAVLSRGVASIPASVKLWLQAARLETEDVAKQRVLRKALERVPNSVRLWRALIDLADEEQARALLGRAVECCPQHVELWLALARLEHYDNARKVLNRARKAVPTEPDIWIAAAKLEEANGNENISRLIPRAIKSLQDNGVVIDRDYWMKAAEMCEKAEPPSPLTCHAIVAAVVGWGVDEQDAKRTWMADAEDAARKGFVETARAIYAHALEVFPGKKSIWRRAAMLEKELGTPDLLQQLLARAVTACPGATMLWLMAAKEKWIQGDVEGARSVLAAAFSANSENEDIWLAAFKLEFESGECERARALLSQARGSSSATAKVWMKSAIVERAQGCIAAEASLLKQGLRKYPVAWKLWLMLGQLEERGGDVSAARQAYADGLKNCASCVPLWTSAARLEEREGNVARARAILEQARLRNPKNEELWLAAIRTEARAEKEKNAQNLLAKSLQQCPSSGVLWAEAIRLAPRPAKKSKCADAMKGAQDSPHVTAAVAQLFMSQRKVDNARNWFERAVTLDPSIGDHWVALYRFELQFGDEGRLASVVERVRKAEPTYGERWCRVSKNPQHTLAKSDEILRLVVRDVEANPDP